MLRVLDGTNEHVDAPADDEAAEPGVGTEPSPDLDELCRLAARQMIDRAGG